MFKRIARPLLVVAVASLQAGFAASVQASDASCDSGNGITLRRWMLNNSYACEAGNGVPEKSADIEAVGAPFNFASWELAEQVSGAGDQSQWLDIEFVVGDWNAGSVFATWELAPGYWDTHETAVFSVYVGDGSDKSLNDFATFIISPGQSNGTLVFAQVSKEGTQPLVGGLAEIRLWTPQS
jgi:hypothetical protein